MLIVVMVLLLLVVHMGWVLFHGSMVDLKHRVQVREGVHRKVHLGHRGNGRQGRQR